MPDEQEEAVSVDWVKDHRAERALQMRAISWQARGVAELLIDEMFRQPTHTLSARPVVLARYVGCTVAELTPLLAELLDADLGAVFEERDGRLVCPSFIAAVREAERLVLNKKRAGRKGADAVHRLEEEEEVSPDDLWQNSGTALAVPEHNSGSASPVPVAVPPQNIDDKSLEREEENLENRENLEDVDTTTRAHPREGADRVEEQPRSPYDALRAAVATAQHVEGDVAQDEEEDWPFEEPSHFAVREPTIALPSAVPLRDNPFGDAGSVAGKIPRPAPVAPPTGTQAQTVQFAEKEVLAALRRLGITVSRSVEAGVSAFFARPEHKGCALEHIAAAEEATAAHLDKPHWAYFQRVLERKITGVDPGKPGAARMTALQEARNVQHTPRDAAERNADRARRTAELIRRLDQEADAEEEEEARGIGPPDSAQPKRLG